MNKKLIGAVLGTFAIAGMNIARAEDAPKAEKPAKEAKGKKKAKGDKGAEKSCSGADGKGCSGDKKAK